MNVEPWMDLGVGDGPPAVVTAAQHLLNGTGASLTPDGAYGPLTQESVRIFQRSRSYEASGTLDANTWDMLVPTLRLGDRGDAVRALQVLDPEYFHGPPVEVDGVLGANTEWMVRFYQDAWGLGVDGVVGDLTWSHLLTNRPGVLQWPLVGSRGDRYTTTVQHLLNHHGFATTVDGVFGPATGEAVRQWQSAQRARYVSNTVGFLDWPELVVTLRRGDRGDAVRGLQEVMWGVTVDGIFGEATERALDPWNRSRVATVEVWNRHLWPTLE
ncbi:MAG: peptidoglycan-binding protein [Ornithinimicrobium sp.]